MIGVTTIRDFDISIREAALERAKVLRLPFVERGNLLESMAKEKGLEGFLVYGRKPPYFWSEKGEYHFHLGTAVLRMNQISRGNPDRLCDLLPKEEFVSVLDCTFGEGKDSAVFAWYLQERGKVTALEKSLPLYEVGRGGLSSYKDKNKEIEKTLKSITLVHEDYRTFLQNQKEKAFDVIYFDPMFWAPVKKSVQSMEGFRNIASYDDLDEEIIHLAMKVARKQIIIKERPFSRLFKQMPWIALHHTRGQTTAYGVIDL